jgi:hypothetical protein
VTGVLDALRTRYRLAIQEYGSAVENAVFKPVRIG